MSTPWPVPPLGSQPRTRSPMAGPAISQWTQFCDVADELAEEERRADRAAPAIAGVLEIGGVALELVLEILEERQAPHLLAAALDAAWNSSAVASFDAYQPEHELPSATTHAPVSVALSTSRSGSSARAYASASARMRRPSASVLMISTLLPSSEPHTSPGRYALPSGMFSAAAKMPCTSTFGLRRADDLHEADDVRRAAHVVLHLAHARGGLDGEAAGVERDALADERRCDGGSCCRPAGTCEKCTMHGLCSLPWPTAWSRRMPRFWISL